MNYETLLFHEAIRLLIISVRQKQQHTQQSLSIESGISRQFISQLECGKRIPSIDTLCQLAIALKTSMGSLMAELDRIYQHLFRQRQARQNDNTEDYSARSAADTRTPSLEYIRKARGLDKP
ncbi:Helix-turn-helix [Fibrobacter sp. UWB7]|nr:Helix-turn-helix [Fibrobacter sp. UWB7]